MYHVIVITMETLVLLIMDQVLVCLVEEFTYAMTINGKLFVMGIGTYIIRLPLLYVVSSDSPGLLDYSRI